MSENGLRAAASVVCGLAMAGAALGQTHTIYGDRADADILVSTLAGVQFVSTASNTQAEVGMNGGFDRCYVMPFALPALAPGQRIASASFSVSVAALGSDYTSDLYGLGWRSEPTVLLSDWYSGTLDTTDAWMVEEDFLPAAPSGSGRYGTSAAGGEGLVAYLNAQIDAGAGEGDFVFLRISHAVDNSPNLKVNFFKTADLAYYLADHWGQHQLPSLLEQHSPRLVVTLTEAAEPCPADFDGSGGVNVNDLLAFLGAFRGQAAEADFDGSGSVNVNDLLGFLGAFRAGCEG